jgi:IS30 family transposase
MTELTRNEIIRRFLAGSSIRQIARELRLARNTVSRVLAHREAQRAGASPPRAGGRAGSIPTSRSSRTCWAATPI